MKSFDYLLRSFGIILPLNLSNSTSDKESVQSFLDAIFEQNRLGYTITENVQFQLQQILLRNSINGQLNQLSLSADKSSAITQ